MYLDQGAEDFAPPYLLSQDGQDGFSFQFTFMANKEQPSNSIVMEV
jgi:hypothetical protein